MCAFMCMFVKNVSYQEVDGKCYGQKLCGVKEKRSGGTAISNGVSRHLSMLRSMKEGMNGSGI